MSLLIFNCVPHLSSFKSVSACLSLSQTAWIAPFLSAAPAWALASWADSQTHKLQTYSSTNVGAETTRKKQSLSEKYENCVNKYNWNSRFWPSLFFSLSELTFACSQDCWWMRILFVWPVSQEQPCFNFPQGGIRFRHQSESYQMLLPM